MSKSLIVAQSMWAMERRAPDGREDSIAESLEKIAGAGFDAISAAYIDPAWLAEVAAGAKARGLVAQAEWQCFPKTIDDLKPAMEFAAKWGGHHLCLQADIRPRRLADCITLLEGWLKLAEQSPLPVLIETHRDRMTTDLFFTLDLMEALPDLPLVADVSHFLVGREFAWPVDDENHAMIRRIFDNSWAMHGRVASREQVQIELSFPHHRPWLDLFLDWWQYGMESFVNRSAADEPLWFGCELGPRPYAITDRNGLDSTDRWAEALMLRDLVRARWGKLMGEAA
jgi:hypothetical protein